LFLILNPLGDSTFFRLILQQGFALFAGFRFKRKGRVIQDEEACDTLPSYEKNI
jgi:hypothetical protein